MVYKDSAGKEIHEGDSLMDLTPGFVGEISEVFLDEDEGELAVNQDGTTIYLYEIDTEVSSLIVNEETMNIEKEQVVKRNVLWWIPLRELSLGTCTVFREHVRNALHIFRNI